MVEMMPFSSTLSQYVSEIQDLELSGKYSSSNELANENMDKRSSPYSSYEMISSISDNSNNSGCGNYTEHPLLSEREAIKIKAQVLFIIYMYL